MRHAWRPVRLIGLGTLAAGLIVASGTLPACKGSGRRPVKATPGASSYDGPPVEVDASGPQHVIVFQAPSAGWSFSMDRAESTLRVTEVFVTATRPNPAFMYTQQVVHLRAGTGVDAKKPVDVYIRVLDYGARAGSEPYRLVTHAPR